MMLHPTQELEPPANPARFNSPMPSVEPEQHHGDGTMATEQTYQQPQPQMPPSPAASQTWREAIQLDTGEASISLPTEITPEAFEDFKEWIAFVHKRLERRLKASKEAEAQ
jgi:hypothetical protein